MYLTLCYFQHSDSALILAVKRNQVGAVECLLDAKAKPDISGAVWPSRICDIFSD